MFENGEATDVVNENHKGDAPRRVSRHSSLFGCGVAVEFDTQGGHKQIAEKPERVNSQQMSRRKALRRKVRVSRRQPAQFDIFKGN